MNTSSFLRFTMISVVILTLSSVVGAQCETWIDHPKQDEAEGAHSIYRQALKNDNFSLAEENWRVAYQIAPAADGRRDYHFTDGVKIYKWLAEQTDDEKLKKAYRDSALMMFDGAAECYRQQKISVSKCAGDQECYDRKVGFILGRKAYEMYYTFNMPRDKIYENLKQSVELAGNASEYIIYEPMGAALTALFQRDEIDAVEVRTQHALLKQIAAHNIANKPRYKDYYESALKRLDRQINKVEDEVYDCDYFVDKLTPQLEEYPDSGALLREVYETLLDKDCDTSMQVMQDLQVKYDAYMLKYRDKVRRELAKSNPNIAAKLFYDEGKFEKALQKYEEAIATTDDEDKMAEYYFSMASIQGRKLKRYSDARSSALKAAQYRSNWGRPYLLIGDLYASAKCGDSWNQRLSILAAIDKYRYARNIDPEVESTANRRIANYRNSKPIESEGFMRGLKEGDEVEVGCWIGETVKIRFSEN